MEKATAYMTLWSRCNVSPCVFCTMGNPKKNLEPREYGIWKNVNEIACKIAALDWDKYDKISFVGGEALSLSLIHI